ncbi:MAG: low molecular weight phosphotyrosine protein phosphatase [Proteobacteria bacterium]|nr:low molecular weight phosphotyrosine protein phosphatase [Pseudomonadota bacterium]NOG59985.1 low molecular weight phosphotyrosine protein phosphatase [Pseudomonadota bacterium]
MGNICRSPTGEGVFQYYVEAQGHADNIYIDSAGTIAYHEGEPADARMREVAAKRNYQLNSIARKVIPEDIEKFDLIIAMDQDNLYELELLAGGKKQHLRLLGSFLDGQNNDNAPSVPDPYYGGLDGFEQVLDMIEEACPNLLSHCLEISDHK